MTRNAKNPFGLTGFLACSQESFILRAGQGAFVWLVQEGLFNATYELIP